MVPKLDLVQFPFNTSIPPPPARKWNMRDYEGGGGQGRFSDPVAFFAGRTTSPSLNSILRVCKGAQVGMGGGNPSEPHPPIRFQLTPSSQPGTKWKQGGRSKNEIWGDSLPASWKW